MKILVFGDSHSTYFGLSDELKSVNESFKGVNIQVVTIPGSTILGFGKRQSTLNSKALFLAKLKAFKPDYICFALGQVDIELGLYYRKIVKGESVDVKEYISNLVEKYLSTINDIQNDCSISDEAICLKGINLSVLTTHRAKAVDYTSRIITENIEDKNLIEEYNKKLKLEYPSNLERYRIHTLFNEVLFSAVRTRYSYFDINDVIADGDNFGSCRKEFIPFSKDHHILDSLFIREISISRLIKSCVRL